MEWTLVFYLVSLFCAFFHFSVRLFSICVSFYRLHHTHLYLYAIPLYSRHSERVPASVNHMLVISRHRQEIEDSGTAQRLATKFNEIVWSIPLLYDFPLDSPIIDRLRALPQPACFLTPLSKRSAKNLLLFLQIPFADVFETEDAVQIHGGGITGGKTEYLLETLQPRWYPIIDKSQCIACLECVNYCLFGVYAIDKDSRPFVDQPDSCRDGCPACARVCPSRAIMFPLYEERTIAGFEQEPASDINTLVDLVDQI